MTTGQVARFALSDGINATAGFVVGQTLSEQFLSANRPVGFRQYNAFRPEETFVAGAPRGDTQLLVIAGPTDAEAPAGQAGRNPALRVDLQVAADGRTGAGVGVGGIGRLPGAIDPTQGLALSGAMVGSTRVAGIDRGSTAILSNFGSLGTNGTGVGTHVFGGNDTAPGQIGYFAVGESDTRLGAPGTPAGSQPGTLTNVGDGTPATSFGFTRLATNVGAPALGTAAGAVNIQGYATAMVEAPVAGTTTVFSVLGDITVRSRNGDREFDATLRLSPRAPGEVGTTTAPPAGRQNRTLAFGQDGTSGAPPTTAVVAQGSFAGVIPGQAALASVDGTLLAGIQRPDGTPAGMALNPDGTVARSGSNPVAPGLPPSSAHLAWGFFLGDLVPQANGAREYANLGFWVAGRPVDYGTLQTLTGTGNYQGGMIGNVADSRGLRTVAGDFRHSFDFGRRTGSMTANFDRASFTVPTGMTVGAAAFTGSGGAPGVDRVMSVQGGFFHNAPTPIGPTNLPVATGGVFGVTGAQYGASGIFVGARP